MIQLPTVTPAPVTARPGHSAPAPPRPAPPPAQFGPPTAAPEAIGKQAPQRRPGRFRSKVHISEQESRDRDRLVIPLRSPRRIAVVALKGGVGKTTLSVLLAGIYSQHRREPVLLLDADPTFGSLLLRSGVAPTHSARDLAGRGDPGELDVLLPYLAMSGFGTFVLPSGLDPGESARFDEGTFVATMDVVHRHFPVTVIDCGAGLSGGLMTQLLGGAHTLVFATSPSVDGLTATYAGLRWIAERGFAPLVANSFVVVTAVRHRGGQVDLAAAARRFDGLCRGLLSVPDDPHLRAGARIDQAALADRTRAAMTHLAAEVLEAAQRIG
ncbi:MAG: MinD/ParA family protein [Actinomycetota bacterium]|nr:MinD/ParA family protein [Actinomycetota bacterium]